jgi:hypothetical protein
MKRSKIVGISEHNNPKNTEIPPPDSSGSCSGCYGVFPAIILFSRQKGDYTGRKDFIPVCPPLYWCKILCTGRKPCMPRYKIYTGAYPAVPVQTGFSCHCRSSGCRPGEGGSPLASFRMMRDVRKYGIDDI